jgi:HD-GYP domain-containing protein (c-di-GMP phosphodiesterase class II)
MKRKPVPVGELQFGMYVAELDRPWTETPFVFQGFRLSTEQQLQALRRLCRYVYVDAARGTPSKAGVASAAGAATPTFAIHGSAAYSAQTELGHEIELAAKLHRESLQALAELLEPLERGAARLDGREVERVVHDMAESVMRNPDALLVAAKARQAQAAAHARAVQVSVYMMAFGRFLQREPDEIALLGLLGLLQDVGKARLPAGLLAREAALTPEETELVKKHVELSAHILGVTSGLPIRLPALAMLHHERQDGHGYPRGLRGYQIGLFGAIAAICDAYDAELAPPPHGAGRSPGDAVKALLRERGSAYHGPLLEQFVRCVGAFPVGSVVELASGETGVVIGENLLQRLKPKVLLVADRAGKRLHSRTVVDLLSDARFRIRRTLDEGAIALDAASTVQRLLAA